MSILSICHLRFPESHCIRKVKERQTSGSFGFYKPLTADDCYFDVAANTRTSTCYNTCYKWKRSSRGTETGDFVNFRLRTILSI